MAFFEKNWFLLLTQAIALGLSYAWLYLNQDKLKIKFWELIIFMTVGYAGGFFFAKFFAVIEAGFDWKNSANYRIFGPILFDVSYILAYSLLRKMPIKTTLDIVCITVLISMFLARTNCLFEGCCYGKYIGSTNIRWPIRETEMLYDALLMIIFIPKIYKGKTNGEVYPIYIASYGFLRFCLEWFREFYIKPGESNFHLAHIWSISFILIGSIWLGVHFINQKKEKCNNEKC